MRVGARRWASLAVLFLAPASWGCDKNAPKAEAGALGHASFGYMWRQPNAGDPYCDLFANSQQFPTVAVGGRFGISVIPTYIPHTDESMELVTFAPDRLEIDDATGVMFDCGGDFCTWGTPKLAVAHAAGYTGLFAQETDYRSDGQDFINVKVADVAGLALTQITEGANGQISGSVGPVSGTASFQDKQVFLRAAPVDASGGELAGALPTPYAWTTSAPSVVAVLNGANTNIVEIALGSPGTATLTVTMGTSTTSATVAVQ